MPILKGGRAQVKWPRFSKFFDFHSLRTEIAIAGGIVIPMKISSHLLWTGWARAGSSIIVAMEIVFLDNFLEAAESLRDGEILFCPSMGRWLESMVEEDIVDYNLFIKFGYYEFRYDERMNNLFFYVLKPGLIISSWEEIFEGVRKNDRYFNKEILAGVELFRVLENYYLFLYKEFEVSEKERRFIKSMIEGEVEKELVKKEAKNRNRYLEAVKGIYRNTFPKLRLKVGIERDVKEKGVEGVKEYIKEGKAYVESLVEGKRVLSIFPVRTGVVEVETNFVVEYDMDKVYIAFGKVSGWPSDKSYILGVPLFRGEVSKISSTFRLFGREYKFVEIKKKEESKTGRDKLFAELRADTFDISILYAKEFKIIEKKGNRKVIEVEHKDSKEIRIRASGKEGTGDDGHKLCVIEIGEDGKFSAKAGYGNVLEVVVEDSRGDLVGTKELKELIEKRKVVRAGRILREFSYSIGGKRELVLEESDYLDEVSEYIVSRLYEFANRVVRGKEGYRFLLDLSKGDEEEKILANIVQTIFIQDKVDKILGNLRKIADLCYESDESRRLIKSHNIEDPEKMANDIALYATGIDVDGLRGKEKKIVEVLKLISYSYPIMDRPNMEKVLEELKRLVGAIFPIEKAPLDEIRVKIQRLVPEYLELPVGRAATCSSALILLDGDSVKVYAKSHRRDVDYPNVKEVEIGLGDVEIRICKIC